MTDAITFFSAAAQFLGAAAALAVPPPLLAGPQAEIGKALLESRGARP